jgi:predicted nuclease of restriction endonuclease-like RecB superfamily
MSNKENSIENRVYLFESLARGFIEKSADDLSGKNRERRSRAIRALADLAYVSCTVADSEGWSSEEVRGKVLDLLDAKLPVPNEADDEPDDT